MPPMETADLYQKAMLWPFNGVDAFGQPTVGSPVDVNCRYVERQTEMLDAQGNTVAVDATMVVDRDVAPGSNVWVAPHSDIAASEQWYGTGTGTGSAAVDTPVYYVKLSRTTTDIKNRFTRRTLGLMRFRDAPATG